MSTTRRFLYFLLFLAAVLFAAYELHQLISGKQKKAIGSLFSPNFSVEVVKAKQACWPKQIDTTGALHALQEVMITASTTGHLTQKLFAEGQHVDVNTPLLILEQQTQFHQLQSAKASFKLAQLTWQRRKKLLASNNIAQADVDSAYQQMQATAADLAEAQTQYQYTTITAPFSGKLGISSLQIGDYITPTTPLMMLQNDDQLYIDAPVSEAQVAEIKKGEQAHFTVAAFPKQQFTGIVQTLDSGLSQDTRMLTVRIIINNSKHQLKAGMFATITILSVQKLHGFSLPDTAVGQSIAGDTVYMVQKGIVHLQSVQLLARKENRVLIANDLGQTPIVSVGQTRVFEGATAKIVDSKTTAPKETEHKD